ncbi:MAG TPA: 1-acyl-sn-glycerol-3-phosphate acyltransferase [Solirubrobacteraceae bacterium]|nr:1-acyl-sn-glycerol-3-phosphate acyltransferase [Solirubrobacteraceae bacterium]
MPPAPVRRPLTITTWLVVSSVCLLLSPLVLAAGEIAAALMRRPQPKILARLVIEYFARELLILVACGGLWLISGCGWRIHAPRLQRAHYGLLRWFVHGLSSRVRELLDIRVETEPSEEAFRALRTDRPLLFFSRHAGPGDTVFLTDVLMTRYDRLPSIVFKDALTLDPCVDLLGHRLPHAVLDTSDAAECEERIRDAAARLGPRGALMLFPEGGNFTPERRRRSIRKLWRKGLSAEASAAEKMSNVMPPHPAGALAALKGNPDSDVIFGAHTGLGLAAFPRDLWRHPPIGRTLTTRMWRVPAAERPDDPDRQGEWLYDWWKRIDAWVGAEAEEGRGARP